MKRLILSATLIAGVMGSSVAYAGANFGVSLSGASLSNLPNRAVMYQGVFGYTKENVRAGLNVGIEARLGLTGKTSETTTTSGITATTDLEMPSALSLFVKTANVYDDIEFYALVGYSSFSLQAKVSSGGISTSASADYSGLSYGVGLSKSFGERSVGIEYIQYHGDLPNVNAFGVTILRRF